MARRQSDGADRRLLILADDFTGACDAAGAFGASLHTLVTSTVPRDWPTDVQVLALDLDVRERPAAEAQAVIESAARTLGAGTDVFVKIDSTLRGPIAGLVGGALIGSGKEIAVVAPAFPERGRLILDGRLVTDGREGPRVVDVLGTHHPTLIVDADASGALREVAQTARGHPEWLLVGSAGLARHLAPPAVGPPHLPRLAPHRPVLVVAGSPAPVTRAQLRCLDPLDECAVFSTPPTRDRDSGEAARALAEAVLAWAAENARPRALVVTGGATASRVCDRLGVRALRILGELEPGIPVGTLQGGPWDGLTVVTKAGSFGTPETLLDVARALGVSSLPQAHD